MIIRAGLPSILIVFAFLLLAPPAGASFSSVYIAQTAQGASTGLNCANAFPAVFFNTGGDWGIGTSQIGPGTTVHLCGTFTAASAGMNLLTFHGGGSIGNPVTLLFETGAVLQSPAFPGRASNTGAINLGGYSYIVVDGGAACGEVNGALVHCNGKIQNTLAGSKGAVCPGGICTQQVSDSVAVYSPGSASNIEIRNLEISNMYNRLTTQTADGSTVWSVFFNTGTYSSISVHNNVLWNASSPIVLYVTGTSSNLQVYNNNVQDARWHIAIAGSSGVGNRTTGIVVHDNEIYNWDNWVTPAASYHTNGIIIFDATSGSTIGDTASYIYNNYLHGDLTGRHLDSSATAMISPQDNATGLQIFNNRIDSTCTVTNPTRSCSQAIWSVGAGGGGVSVYNNTINCAGAGGAMAIGNISFPNTYKNNVVTGCVAFITIYPNNWSLTGSSDHNLVFGQSVWACNNASMGYSCLSLAQRQTQQSADLNSVSRDPRLDSSDRLLAGSAAIGLGANLTSLGIAALSKDAMGAARSATASWDAGAYQFQLLGPPSGLTLIVH